MSARTVRDMALASNPDLDEYLRQEDLSEDEIQRVYDLRYCTILVPVADRRRETRAGEDEGRADESEVDTTDGQEEHQEQQEHNTNVSIRTTSMTSLHPSPAHSPSNSPVLPTERAVIPQTPPRPAQALDRPIGLLTPQEKLTPGVLVTAASITTDQSPEKDDDDSYEQQQQPQGAYKTFNHHARYHHPSSIGDNEDDSDIFMTESEYLTDPATNGEKVLSSSSYSGATEVIKQENLNSAASHTPEPIGRHNASQDSDVKDQYLEEIKRSLSTAASSSSSSPGAKRRHWELTPTRGLLHQRQPESPKRSTLSSAALSGRPFTVGHRHQVHDHDRGFMRTRSLEEPALRTSSMSTKSLSSGSTSSHASLFTSTVPLSLQESPSDGPEWTRSNWQSLEQVYLQMNGDIQSEAGLGQIADRFLAEETAHTREESPWNRQRILTRCIALQMVEKERRRRTPTSSHAAKEYLTPFTPLLGPRQVQPTRRQVRGVIPPSGFFGERRASSQPYPVDLLHVNNNSSSKALDTPAQSSSAAYANSAAVSASGASTPTHTALSQFIERQRFHRNQRAREHDQGSKIKTVFKQRLAEGLNSVRQLLPFWKEVEQGEMDIKEEVEVPLVRPRKIQKVIEAFETNSLLHCNSSSSSRGSSVREGSLVSSRANSALLLSSDNCAPVDRDLKDPLPQKQEPDQEPKRVHEHDQDPDRSVDGSTTATSSPLES